MRLATLVSKTLLSLLAISLTAFAQTQAVDRYLTAAKSLFENLEYERALEQLDRARKNATTVEADVDIALYEGVIRAEMRQKEQAIASFKTGLFLNPSAVLPLKVAPKVVELFEQTRTKVKEQLAKMPRPVQPKQTPNAQSGTAVTQVPATALPSVEQARPFPVAPVVVMGTAVVAAGVGGFFGWQSSKAVNAAQGGYQMDVPARMEAAQRNATIANGCYIGAGVAAASAIIWYFAVR